MVLDDVMKSLSDSEKLVYEAQTASEYFRFLYYSIGFSKILKKLNSREKLSEEDWDYLIKRLFLVTVKAMDEEDPIKVYDKINYVLNRIGTKVLNPNSKLYNECVKMVAFINSITMEEEINDDLLKGLGRVEESKDEMELDILLRQHREASIFRANQDSFIDSYHESKTGFISEQERVFMNSMDRAFIREKNLVKEYEK